jgi:hypothetical protein
VNSDSPSSLRWQRILVRAVGAFSLIGVALGVATLAAIVVVMDKFQVETMRWAVGTNDAAIIADVLAVADHGHKIMLLILALMLLASICGTVSGFVLLGRKS